MEVVLRRQAMEQEMVRYFTGQPCVRGHVAERYVRGGKCVACKREAEERPEHRQKRRDASRAKYRKNPIPDRERAREYKARNPDRERNRQRAYYERHRTVLVAAAKVRQYEAYRKKLIERAKPKWLKQSAIRRLNEQRDRLRIQTRVYTLRVTPIIPLAGRIVCGLYVPENLRIGSETFELSQHTRFTYAQQDMESARYLKWLKQQGL